MSLLFRRYIKHGYQFRNQYEGFWALGNLDGTKDPSIPTLPLNAAVASTVTLSLAVTESSDTVAINADVSGGTITASLAATETSDTVAITGTNRTTAALAVTETSDTVAITGSNRTTATLAATETSDTVAITGSNRTTATLAVTETADTVAINGTNATTVALSATETADTVSIAADVLGGTITVSLAATETSDTVAFNATAAGDEQPIGGGHAWKGPAEPKYRVHPDYEDRPKKKKRVTQVGEQVILAGEPEIQTGIIAVRPAWDVMAEMQQRAEEAERARQERLRAIALADDEWLMVA